MKNNKNKDKLTVNEISAPININSISEEPVANAGTAPFCVYAGERHAVGSIIKKEDGSELICTENGSWQNK